MADSRLMLCLLCVCSWAAFGCLLISKLNCFSEDVSYSALLKQGSGPVWSTAGGFGGAPTYKLGRGMTLVFVICERHFDLGMVAIKSAVAYSTSLLNLIIIADKANTVKVITEVTTWPESIKRRVQVDVQPVWYPNNEWWGMFEPCATQRLFLPSMLPNEDAVIYVDTDVVFLHPVEDFWRMFAAMNGWQMAAMAPETESYTRNWYLVNATHPFVRPFALNAGLLMMNLTRMRAFGLERRVVQLKREFEGQIPWADQDLLNILFTRHPERIFTFTCRWNYRAEHCDGSALCTDGPVAAVHGSRRMFLRPSNPAFTVLHEAIKKYNLGESLVHNFIDPLNVSLAKSTQKGCVREFTQQLHLWRRTASHVDTESKETRLVPHLAEDYTSTGGVRR
ncbi:glucoside xylosyltransferase 1-like isoform X2 [Haemaphysalis longicornis]